VCNPQVNGGEGEKMNTYIANTKYAVEELIELITMEESKLIEAGLQLGALQKQHEILYQDFLRKDFDPDDHFNEHQLMNAFNKQSEVNLRIESIMKRINDLKKVIDTHAFSYQVLAGAILQIAKQGISIVNNGLTACPDGRIIGNETLKNIIWQGRNQALHYEEGRFSPQVISCFNNLEHSFGSKFSLAQNQQQNLSKEVIELLGWRKYEAFERDMKSLLG
jgi:hypothetical protein